MASVSIGSGLRHDSSDATATWREVIDGVDRELCQARGVGNAAYTDPTLFAAEGEQLFANTWSCIGVGSDVPNPGDVRPTDIFGIPLLLVRTLEGDIRVFHNVCSHRGVRLVEQAGHVKRVIVCPYHSWSYCLDGVLYATPHLGGQGKHACEGFDTTRHGLREVRSESWFDLVFVNLSGGAAPFAEHIEPLSQRWAHYDTAQFRHGGSDSHWTLGLACNWKLAVENHNDAYHLPWVHPDLNRYSRFEDHYDVLGDDLYAGQGSRAYRPRRPNDQPALPVLAGIPEPWRDHAEYISVFPNAIIGIHQDHYWTVWLEPKACDQTMERMNLYFVGEAAVDDQFEAMRRLVRDEWLKIWAEDQEIVERMQRGRASPGFAGGTFSPALDAPVHRFHRWYVRQIATATSGREAMS